MAKVSGNDEQPVVEYASKASEGPRDSIWVKGWFAIFGAMLGLLMLLFLVCPISPRLGGPTPETKEKATIAQRSNLETLLQAFNDDTGRFPTQAEGLDALVHQPPGLPNWHRQLDDVPMDSWGQPFVYRFPGKKDPAAFDLISVGADGKEGTADDITR